MIRIGCYIFLVFLVLASKANGQEILKKYIPIPPQELSVKQYLFHIEEMTGVKLAYSTTIVEDKSLALRTDSMELSELLDTLFSLRDLTYIQRDNQLILSPQAELSENANRIKVKGKIINSRNGNPIPYVNVFIPNQSKGTISNYEGDFELVIPLKPGVDSLVVTCMGYKREKILPFDFLRGEVTVELKPYRFQIEELIVKPVDPEAIIRGLLANKSENYPEEPQLLKAFFREVARQDGKYVSLSEALIDIYKPAYTAGSNDLVQLQKGRRGSNTEQSEFVNFVVEGGLYNHIQLDIVKYGISFLEPENFKFYDYNYERRLEYNNRSTYVISFQYKENPELIGFNGKIYVDIETLGLVRAEFAFSNESLEKANSLLVKKVPRTFRIRPRHGIYEVEYRFYQEKWNLNYARSELELKLRKKGNKRKKGFTSVFTTSSEFVITGRQEGEFDRIRYRDASKPGDVLYEQVANSDYGFWGNETIITPEEPLLETIRKLQIEETVKDPAYLSTSGNK